MSRARTNTLLQLREQGRTPLQLRGQRFDRAQRRRTDVMFHALDVVMDHALVETEQGKEIAQELVAARNVAGERLASRGQNQAAILFVFEEAIAVETLDHVGR